MEKLELDKLAHGIAYDSSSSTIDCNCRMVDGIDPVAPTFFDISDEGISRGAEEFVKEAVEYLDARGLIERHPNDANWVTVRDESEAVA